jgi:hypothetical protein
MLLYKILRITNSINSLVKRSQIYYGFELCKGQTRFQLFGNVEKLMMFFFFFFGRWGEQGRFITSNLAPYVRNFVFLSSVFSSKKNKQKINKK